jgi:hypothetical protein
VLKQEQEKQAHLPYQLFINYTGVGSSKKAKLPLRNENCSELLNCVQATNLTQTIFVE